jgi:hypothetical protein
MARHNTIVYAYESTQQFESTEAATYSSVVYPRFPSFCVIATAAACAAAAAVAAVAAAAARK